MSEKPETTLVKMKDIQIGDKIYYDSQIFHVINIYTNEKGLLNLYTNYSSVRWTNRIPNTIFRVLIKEKETIDPSEAPLFE